MGKRKKTKKSYYVPEWKGHTKPTKLKTQTRPQPLPSDPETIEQQKDDPYPLKPFITAFMITLGLLIALKFIL